MAPLSQFFSIWTLKFWISLFSWINRFSLIKRIIYCLDTNIPPSKGGKPEPTVTKTPTTFPSTNSVHSEAAECLSKFTKPEKSMEERITFSGHFSAEVSCRTPSLIELLPLLRDSVNSPAMVKRCMTVIKDPISSLNLNQYPVITADQPVYALGKQIQWLYPKDFIHVVWMMGPLHIEMASINVIGDWLDRSVQ